MKEAKRLGPINPSFDPTRAVFYGQFVEIVYSMYDPANPTPKPSWAFPAGYKFVAWVQMRDFTPFGPGRYVFYGVIASDPSHPNECVLAIRGTLGFTEWFDDFTSLVPVQWPEFGGSVGNGFLEIFKYFRVVYPPQGDALAPESLEPEGSFANQVAAAIRRHSKQPDMQIVVTGHSLGAALGTLYVAQNSVTYKATIPLICTFASPRVGDYAFASKFDQLRIPSWRIRNEPDLIPMQPPPLLFCHIQTEYMYNSLSSVAWTPACWHYLETYLHLLDSAQPLKDECELSARTAATGRLRPAGAPSAQTQNEIALSAPNEAGGRINITIKIE